MLLDYRTHRIHYVIYITAGSIEERATGPSDDEEVQALSRCYRKHQGSSVTNDSNTAFSQL